MGFFAYNLWAYRNDTWGKAKVLVGDFETREIDNAWISQWVR